MLSVRIPLPTMRPQEGKDTMSRISMLFAALCIAAAPVVAATHTSAQKAADKPDRDQADKADKADKAKPETDKAEKFDLDGLIRGIKEMVDKQSKEDKDKPATTPAK
jgi:hypothetical protein